MEIQNPPIQITEKAKLEAKYILDNKNIPEGYGLRVGMRGGGCGASFFLGFDQPKEQDQVFQLSEFRVIIDKRHFMYLFKMELDFEEQESERGFVFNRLP
jgi:iron-sulfur cluster assembly protein